MLDIYTNPPYYSNEKKPYAASAQYGIKGLLKSAISSIVKFTKDIFTFLKSLYNILKNTTLKGLGSKALKSGKSEVDVSYFLGKDKILSQDHLNKWCYLGMHITFEGNENFLKAKTSVSTYNGNTVVEFGNYKCYPPFFKVRQKDTGYLAGCAGDTEISLPRCKKGSRDMKMLMTRIVDKGNGSSQRQIIGSFVVDMGKDPTVKKTTGGVFYALMSRKLTEGASEMYTLNTSLKDKEYAFRR